ncbi:MAG: hypothetical protein AVDCRST_MAG88-544 [uncultured Thermomicrobiales bacterium]|uniref:Uncharacterized protein n=1 Tax=uncultured Thermomicrobiales bacterium TaxID=1645740 RepID=A0A6J4UGX3_9BACT|nr:MAG: hypothetical protein AVDCRST_MAG88-544 [uncultured Thermomicrobiales bacterium]
MATLAELRARVRRALQDTDATSSLWSDADLTDGLTGGYREYSAIDPREVRTTMAPNGTTDYVLPADFLTAVGVEIPAGVAVPQRDPAEGAGAGTVCQSWAVFGGSLRLAVAPTQTITLLYRAFYTFPGSEAAATGLSPAGEEVVLWAAVVAALRQRDVSTGKRRPGSAGASASLSSAMEAKHAAVRRFRRATSTVLRSGV